MKTTVEALKGLYVALGGAAEDVAEITLIPDMIDAIAELKGGDGSGTVGEATVGDATVQPGPPPS